MIRICLNSTVDYTYEMLTRANQSNLQVKKCSDRIPEVRLSVLKGNYDLQTNRPIDQPTDRQEGYREVTLTITSPPYCIAIFT